MSRAQDSLAVLRGLQKVIAASAKSNEECARQIWANSSYRDLILDAFKYTEQQRDAFIKNPSGALEKAGALLRDTVERGAAVAEGVRQYTALNVRTELTPKIPDLTNINIAAVTLKELENLLAENNRMRPSSKATTTEEPTPQSYVHGVKNAIPPVSTSAAEEEKYLKEWVDFLSKHNLQEKTSKPEFQRPSVVAEPVAVSRPVEPKMAIKAPITLPQLSSVAKQRKVPSSRIGRMVSFGGLFAGLGIGTVSELTKSALGFGETKTMRQAVLSPENAERIADTLCKVRGASLKLGQILSMSDNDLIPPALLKAFERVRQAADYMPDWQVEKVLVDQLGDDWRSKVSAFDMRPFAAASIGQVHRATTLDGMEVAIKIQYPGVARGIESDIDNLVGLLNVWNVFPPGMFIENIVKVAKRELAWEVDYSREAEYTVKFGEMIAPYQQYRVPKVVSELSTTSILTTELLPGLPLDACFEMDEEHRLRIGTTVMELVIRELFQFRCMQTDPNWSNFLYDPASRRLQLIDFGSTRFYSKKFMDNYLRITQAAADKDRDLVLRLSREMGFLNGYETRQMEDAHVSTVMITGEVFSCKGEFDFGKQDSTRRVVDLVPTMLAHRLCPPPDEVYSIHRKLSGVFLLCARLRVKFASRPIFERVIADYKFD